MAEEKKWSDFKTLRYNIFDYLSKGEKTDLNDKEKEEVETAIKYAEHYSSEYNDYVNQVIDSMEPIDKIKFDIKNLQANQKAQFIASFFTGEILKENFNDKLKDVENVETGKREEQEANKQNISKPDKINAEQQSSEKVKEEEKKDALKGRMTRNKGETSTYSNGRGTANFTSQNISLPNFPGETKFQKVAVSNYTTDDPKNSTLIKITTNGNNIATFYTEEGKIFLEIHEINLALTLLLKENVDIKKIPIETLCLDKKMDIQVKGLGKSSRKNAQDKNLGFLFSAYGFQMKTDDNNVIFKNDTPFNIEIDEKFLDIALANELSAEKSDKGCILGKDMKLDSSTMQSLLRMVSINNTAISSISGKTSLANGRIKLTTENYQFEQTEVVNGRTIKRRARRPMEFMEIDGKPYVYLSIIENRTNNEHAGRFYELNGINITDDKHIFFIIKDRSLVTLPNEPANSRVVEIPYAAKDFVEKLATNEKIVFSKNSLEANATLSNKTYGRRAYNDGVAQAWDNKDFSSEVYNYDSAGFVRHDNTESVLGKDNIDKNKEENTLDNTVSAQGTAIIYDNTYNSYNSEESSIVSESKSSDENAEEVKEVEHEQDVPSAPPAQDIDKNNENSNDDDEPEYVSYNVAPDSVPPDDKTAEKPNDEQDPQNKTPEPTNEPQQAQQTQEAQPAPQPEPQPTQEAQPTPQAPTPPTAPPAPENEEGPKKKSALDIPFIDGGKDDKGFDKDKSNELAAKLGIGMSAMAVVLFGFSVFMPFLAIIGIGFSVGSIVAFAKAWELFSAGASSAVDRANAKLAKEKLKELKRERKAENALANEQKQQEERTVTKNKNQKQIDSLNEENVAIDARIAMLENQKRALQTQNAILLTHGQNEGEFKNFNIDEANMNEEEKEEFNALLASINVEEAQNEEDFKIPHGERAQIHKENLYETVKDLQKAQLDYNDAQNAYQEAETQLSNETQEVKKLRENQHVASYLGFQAKKKKLEDKLATLSSEEEKKAVNSEIANIEKEINSLTLSDAPRKAVNEYLEQTDKLKTITENYETSKQKIEELKPQIDALTTKRDTQLAVVVNDSMIEAHKDDKEIMSDQKRMATVKINTQYINALDGEIAGLKKLKEQNGKLNSAINKKMEKEDFAKQVEKRDAEYSRRVTFQQKLTKNVDDFLTNISDVTKAEQEYVKSQREEAKKSADLILQGYNLAAEKGLEGEELQKWLENIDLNISNMKRTSPPEFRAGYDELRKQGEQKFAGKVPVPDAKSEKAYAKA